jgi:hypothetical protein
MFHRLHSVRPHSWHIRHVFQQAISEGQNYGLGLYYIYSHMIKSAPEYETITLKHNRSCNIQNFQEQSGAKHCKFLDIRRLYLTCILEYLATSQTDRPLTTYFVTTLSCFPCCTFYSLFISTCMTCVKIL